MQSQNQQTQTGGQTVFEAPYRSTRVGGLTRPIALKAEGGRLKVVNPRRMMLSRTGRHGIWLYMRGDFDIMLYLETSNSGRPYVTMEVCDLPQDACQRVYDVAYKAWVVDGAYFNEVERLLELINI